MTIKRKPYQSQVGLLIVLLFFVCSLSQASNNHHDPTMQAQEYVIGIVPQFETRRMHQIWQPILDYLHQETGYRLVLRGSPTIPNFENEFMQGKFDFAYMNPYHIMLANQLQGYLPLVRDIGRTLYGVLVVRKDGPIRSVKDLANQVIAFPAPNALGASLQIRQEMTDKYQIPIQPIYVKTHDSVYLSVLLGEAAAGGGVQKTLDSQKPAYRSALRIIHSTQPVVPHPLAAHPRVPEKVRNAIKQALLKLAQSKQGQDLLNKIPMKKIGPAQIEDYLPLKELGLERFYIQSN